MVLLCITIASLPLSLLHHHEHENKCEVALNIPTKYKKEKDLYPKHYHSHEKECFLCFQNHFSKSYSETNTFSTILVSRNITFKECIPQLLHPSFIEINGRGPPATPSLS